MITTPLSSYIVCNATDKDFVENVFSADEHVSKVFFRRLIFRDEVKIFLTHTPVLAFWYLHTSFVKSSTKHFEIHMSRR